MVSDPDNKGGAVPFKEIVAATLDKGEYKVLGKGRLFFDGLKKASAYEMQATKMMDISPHLLVENKTQAIHREIADRQVEFYRLNRYPLYQFRVGVESFTNSLKKAEFSARILGYMMQAYQEADTEVLLLGQTSSESRQKARRARRLFRLAFSKDRRQRKRGMRLAKQWGVLK